MITARGALLLVVGLLWACTGDYETFEPPPLDYSDREPLELAVERVAVDSAYRPAGAPPYIDHVMQELVADRATRRPFAPERRLHARVKSEAMARGLMCYPNAGTIDGTSGDHILLAPPYIVTDAELELIVDRLAAAIDAALATADQAAA